MGLSIHRMCTLAYRRTPHKYTHTRTHNTVAPGRAEDGGNFPDTQKGVNLEADGLPDAPNCDLNGVRIRVQGSECGRFTSKFSLPRPNGE
jgi:hypothetical protein